jgi:serine/threonine protein kinase
MSERTLSPPYRPGDLLMGRYELRTMLDQGGMSEVYLAFDRLLERHVVVKSPRVGAVGDGRSLARFRREARALARLSHPGVVTVYDVSLDGGCPFLVEEHVQGSPLAHVISSLGALPPHRAAEIAADVADALAAAHDRGIVHRDVKPGNVMLLPSGAVKVLDFGIAWAAWWTPPTESGEVQGTALYCSPEQVRGERVDDRSDIYSLGVVLFEMLVGRPPFTAEHPLAIARQHVGELPPPLPPSIPPDLAAVVRRCLAKHPEDRFRSARQLAAGLRRLTRPEETTGPMDRNEPTTPLPAQHRRCPWRRGAMAAVLTLVGALLWSLAGSVLSADPRRPALPAPTGLTAQAGCEGLFRYGVALGWNSARGSTGYAIVRRSEDRAQFRRVATVQGRTNTAYQDSGLSGATTYVYGVRSLRGTTTGGLSATVRVTTKPLCFG